MTLATYTCRNCSAVIVKRVEHPKQCPRCHTNDPERERHTPSEIARKGARARWSKR